MKNLGRNGGVKSVFQKKKIKKIKNKLMVVKLVLKKCQKK